MNQIIMEVAEYLKSYDCKPSRENIIRTLNTWIKNLYSHIGPEAHKHSLECGVVDKTGLTWEEKSILMLEQISDYKKCLLELESMSDDELEIRASKKPNIE